MFDDSEIFPDLPRRADAVIKEYGNSWVAILDKDLCEKQLLAPGSVITVLYPKGKKK